MTTTEALKELGRLDGVEYHFDRGASGMRLWWLNPQGMTVEQLVSDLSTYLYQRLGVEVQD